MNKRLGRLLQPSGVGYIAVLALFVALSIYKGNYLLAVLEALISALVIVPK